MQEVAQKAGLDADDPILKLDPYEHLAYCYRLCIVHHQRGIVGATKGIPPDKLPPIRAAMNRLASMEPIEDFDSLTALIRSGGVRCSRKFTCTLVGFR